MTKLAQADYNFMKQCAIATLDVPNLIMGGPINDAAEYLAIAQYSESQMLRAKFLASLREASYYSENRAMKALVILDRYTADWRAL